MGWRTTAVLVAAVLIAGVIAWFDLHNEVSSGDWLGATEVPAPGEGITRLLRLDPREVTAIRLQRGDVNVRVEHADGRWQGVARPEALVDFVHNVSQLAEIIRLDIEPAQRGEYGLEPPAAVIELERGEQPPILLLLGNHNPSSTGAYAQVGRDGPIVLTGAIALWELDKAIRATREDDLPAASATTPGSAPSAPNTGTTH
jgi:hypothetical protein